MGLTGKFKFRKALWGKIVLQIEEEVKPFWSRSTPPSLQRRWRDTTLMDLAAPEMRISLTYASGPTFGLGAVLCQRRRPPTMSSARLME